MIRVVTDTNVFISALMFGGLPGIFLDLAFSHAFTLATSPLLLDELDEKLRSKFHVSVTDTTMIRARLEKTALLIEPGFTLDAVTEDPVDIRVVECAVASKANYIVSGDRHLLKLGIYQGISILTVRQFLEIEN